MTRSEKAEVRQLSLLSEIAGQGLKPKSQRPGNLCRGRLALFLINQVLDLFQMADILAGNHEDDHLSDV